MLVLIISSLIITASPNTPTEVIGTAAAPNGERKEIIVRQPPDSPNPFGYVDSTPGKPEVTALPVLGTQEESAIPATGAATPMPALGPGQFPPAHASVPLVSQSSRVYPQDMNPLDYKNQIENTIYQEGNRLIDIQSIPLHDISSAVQPNLQPTITDYPSW